MINSDIRLYGRNTLIVFTLSESGRSLINTGLIQNFSLYVMFYWSSKRLFKVNKLLLNTRYNIPLAILWWLLTNLRWLGWQYPHRIFLLLICQKICALFNQLFSSQFHFHYVLNLHQPTFTRLSGYQASQSINLIAQKNQCKSCLFKRLCYIILL